MLAMYHNVCNNMFCSYGLWSMVMFDKHCCSYMFNDVNDQLVINCTRVCYLARARARVVLAQIEFARAICGSRKILPM